MRPVPLAPSYSPTDAGKIQWLIDRVTQLCNASQVDTPVTVATANAGRYQPIDADLTAIAAISTTAYGRAFLALANEAAFEAYVNMEEGVDYYGVSGTDVALADGGTGTSLADPNADRIMFWDDGTNSMAWLSPTSGLEISGTTLQMTEAARYASVVWVIDGGGSAITTGVKGYIEVPFSGTILQATALADQTGSIVVDVWKDSYANYPPTNADSITASAPITISAGTKSQNDTLTGWTTSITAGDILGFNVDSVSTITLLTITIVVLKT